MFKTNNSQKNSYGAMPDDKQLEQEWEAELERQYKYDLKVMKKTNFITAAEEKLDKAAEKKLAEEFEAKMKDPPKQAEGEPKLVTMFDQMGIFLLLVFLLFLFLLPVLFDYYILCVV